MNKLERFLTAALGAAKKTRYAFGALMLSCLVSATYAAPITVIYQGNFIQGTSGDQGLPTLLGGNPNNLRLRFFVPDFASLVSINSIDVSVEIYDDASDNPNNPDNEAGEVEFVLNGIGLDNLSLACFCGGIEGTDASNRHLVNINFSDPDALLEIQTDGVFFIRVNRDAGDFFVHGATVVIDGTLAPAAVPAPPSLLLLALGLSVMLGSRLRTVHRAARVQRA